MSFRKILVALDNSQSSQSVFERALDLAEVQASQLMLFHCFTSARGETLMPMQAQLGISPNLINDTYQAQRLGQEQHREQVLSFLSRCCDTANSQGINTEFDHKIGDPGSSICQFAAQWEADFIVIGRRGLTGVAEALLGSVSNYVMHHAPPGSSVLVIQNSSVKPS